MSKCIFRKRGPSKKERIAELQRTVDLIEEENCKLRSLNDVLNREKEQLIITNDKLSSRLDKYFRPRGSDGKFISNVEVIDLKQELESSSEVSVI